MNPRIILLAAVLGACAAPAAGADECEDLMVRFDAATAAGVAVAPGTLADARALRAEGQAQHEAGEHDDAIDSLATALDLIGVK